MCAIALIQVIDSRQMRMQVNPQTQSEGGPIAHVTAAAEAGSDEPAASVQGDMHTRLISLQSVLGLPTNRTSIVL